MGRTLPPAATPVPFSSILSGLAGWGRGASETKRFEEELKAYHATEHVFLVSSGKASLFLILKALHMLHPERDEVVVPAYTCYSVPSAIVRAGLRVRLCDVNPDTLDYDYACLGEIVHPGKTEKILAILSIHLFGLPSDVVRVRRMVEGSGIQVVEDAAQSMGGRAGARCLGTLGDVGFFSLGRGKAFSTVEGGIVLTARSDVALALQSELGRFQRYTFFEILTLALKAVLLSLFMNPCLFWIPKGLPFLKLGETHFDTRFSLKRMSGFQAGLARGWQCRLKGLASQRFLNSSAWAEALKGGSGFRQPEAGARGTALLRYPLLIRNSLQRGAILKEGPLSGLGVMSGYPESLDRLGELTGHANNVKCPKAQEVAHQLVTLPVHGYVKCSDRRSIRRLFYGLWK